MGKIKRALLSVYDKTDIIELAETLADSDIEIISTGGTAQKIQEAGIDVTHISEVTNFPEMMEGRVKTLNPKIHGGILARRNVNSDMEELENLNILPIDLVVCNLYPFAQTIDQKDIEMDTALKNIDIGGPTMIRAAAKNYPDVLIIVDPSDYSIIKEKINKQTDLEYEFKKKMAYKAFNHTAEYDAIIQNYFFDQLDKKEEFPEILINPYYKKNKLRYGENPHQKAAFYQERKIDENGITNAVQLEGKELSFNNINDANGAIELIKEFNDRPTAAVIKHTNPCGLASADNIVTAFKKAHAGDPLSAFGSVVAVNREVDQKLAEEIISGDKFIEVIVAPDYSKESLHLLHKRWESLRILKTGELKFNYKNSGYDFKKVTKGLLVQNRDLKIIFRENIKLQNKNFGENNIYKDLLFAWKAVKHVKSNAIVIAKDEMLLGVGAGQMSRVDAMIIAGRKADCRQRGAVVASDAFFPFPDAVKKAGELNIKAIIQPGGSIRDEQVIDKSDELGIAMYFTRIRHFCH